ncbi:MAG: hypothetical protein WC529_03545 [Candidatus Margulisiibacteriota bacterium]
MPRKSIALIFILLFLFTAMANAAPKKTAKSATKKAPSAAKKAAPVLAPVETAKVEEDKIADLKEETNKALTSLKNDLDKVKADNKDAKVGGVIFFRWQKYTQNAGTNVNNFDVDRAYIDIKKKLDWGAASRVTLDVARITGAARQNLFDYLKYAYVEMPLNVSAFQIVPWEMTAKVGLQHTVWIDWADKALNLRYIAKSLVDNEGVMSSSDFGVGALGKVMIAGLPEIEYHGTVLNGTGYATNESDGKKAVALRLNTTAYDAGDNGKVLLGAFGNVESLKSDFSFNGSMKQAGLDLVYKHDLGAANLEYVTGSKSSKKINGYSLGGIFNVGTALGFLPDLSLFARLDNYDPSAAASNDEKKKTFYGVTYDWGKDVKLALDMQTAQTGSGTTTSILYAHSSITF